MSNEMRLIPNTMIFGADLSRVLPALSTTCESLIPWMRKRSNQTATVHQRPTAGFLRWFHAPPTNRGQFNNHTSSGKGGPGANQGVSRGGESH